MGALGAHPAAQVSGGVRTGREGRVTLHCCLGVWVSAEYCWALTLQRTGQWCGRSCFPAQTHKPIERGLMSCWFGIISPCSLFPTLSLAQPPACLKCAHAIPACDTFGTHVFYHPRQTCCCPQACPCTIPGVNGPRQSQAQGPIRRCRAVLGRDGPGGGTAGAGATGQGSGPRGGAARPA